MKRKPVVLRTRVDRDISEAIDYYVRESGGDVALKSAHALERAFLHIGRQPASGAPRYAHELDLPARRSWPVRRYPFLVVYVERNDTIDGWRVLDAQRDIPAWLRGENRI